MPSKKLTNPHPASRAQGIDQWDIVVVPFPFSTQPGHKRRPALVLSLRAFNQQGSTVLAMITTAGHRPWLGDVALTDLRTAGLNTPCLVRIKLFTLDNRLIVKRIGRLASNDQQQVSVQLQSFLPW
jgi:mRNA interferase MazF